MSTTTTTIEVISSVTRTIQVVASKTTSVQVSDDQTTTLVMVAHTTQTLEVVAGTTPTPAVPLYANSTGNGTTATGPGAGTMPVTAAAAGRSGLLEVGVAVCAVALGAVGVL